MPEFERIDKYAQFFGFYVEAALVNVDCEVRIELPKWKWNAGSGKNYAICWEFLKFDILPNWEYNHDESGEQCNFSITTASRAARAGTAYFLATPSDGDCLLYHHCPFFCAHTTNVQTRYEGFTTDNDRIANKLTFPDGRGVPVVTDYIYIQINSDGSNAKTYLDGRCWYRFIKFSLPEYLGLLQQQQEPDTLITT